VHKISEGHPDYTKIATDKKVEGIQGPYLCESFNTENPGVCEACPHWGKIKSPITLGQFIKPAEYNDRFVEDEEAGTVEVPKYPKPYFRKEGGGVGIKDYNEEDGTYSTIDIYKYDLYVVRRIWDEEDGESIMVRVHMPTDGIRDFTIPNSIITSPTEFKKELARYGIISRNNDITNYLYTWIDHLQVTKKASLAHRHLGWTRDKTAFILGDKQVFSDRIDLNPPSSATVDYFHLFDPMGTLDEWKRAIALFDRPGLEPHQFFVSAGFGSVLMGMTSMWGGGFHLHSEGTGFGKSSALYGAASIFASPKNYSLMNTDTKNSLFQRAEIYHSLVLPVDEMTDISADEVSQFVYQLTEGRQRGRMKGSENKERRRVDEPWQMITLSTGNRSLINILAAKRGEVGAIAQRMFEYDAPELTMDKREADDFNRTILSNYGHAGIPFLQHVMTNRAQVQQEIIDMQNSIERASGMGVSNRFWSVVFATTLVALRHAKRLGLVPFDEDNLYNWAVKAIQERIKLVGQYHSDVDQIVNDFVYENYSKILRIDSTAKTKDKALTSDAEPHGDLVARYEPDLGKLYMRSTAFKTWCAGKGYDHNSVIKRLKRDRSANQAQVRLTRGTSMDLPPARCIVVSYTGHGPDQA
ncbi:MAG TPA: DUF927 domain-containing protein, partial [Candidatus Paceibacterota bacterium]|nr:DUF927 domain-containing protein [Candidatus Paceibacterota bacterium]